jgi:hypothetical protein
MDFIRMLNCDQAVPRDAVPEDTSSRVVAGRQVRAAQRETSLHARRASSAGVSSIGFKQPRMPARLLTRPIGSKR